MTTKLLSIGNNSKLHKKVAVFNLPRARTCPGKTVVCDNICYAKKSGIYKAAVAMRERNLVSTKAAGFVPDMIAELKTNKVKLMRWHEAGDVFSQDYLNDIFAICSALPDVIFLMYTKSFHLNFIKRPSNLRVYWSVDSSTTAKVPTGVTATTVLKGETTPAAATCIKQDKEKHYCGSSCTTCWTGTASVYFPVH